MSKEIKEVKEVKEVEEIKEVKSGIKVNDIEAVRPKELPLVVELPKDASLAQVAYAKSLNAYAYQNREKWLIKKDALIAKLESLENAPDPIEGNLKVNNSFV